MTCSVAHWMLEIIVVHSSMQGDELLLGMLSILVSCVYILVCWRKDTLDHTNVECRLCTLQSTCRPFCNIDIHLITLLNILMPRC